MMTKVSIYLFILLMANPILANSTLGQSIDKTKVSISLDNATVVQVFDAIEKQTSFSFVYDNKIEQNNFRFSLNYGNISVRKLLEKISQEAQLKFQILNNSISVNKRVKSDSKIESVITREIKGKVTDTSGTPLPGANITIKGTTIGTTTNFDGDFTLEVPDDADIIVISYVGYKTKEVILGTNSNFNIQLQEDASQLDEIVLKGYARSDQKSINIKRNSLSALDVLAADDIGKLPDFNAGDALRRVPGVNIIQDQAEARFVSLRGLNANYNSTTVDGFRMASPDRNGRRIFMDILPSSLASRIEVSKTVTSDMDGHAIGGQVNFKSRSAYDYADQLFSVSTSLGKYSNDEGYRGDGLSGTAEIAWANKFGDNDEFGLVLDASYYKRESYIPQLETGSQWYWFDNAGNRTEPYGGNGIATPRERRWYLYHNDRQRYGFNGKFEYKPSENFHLAVGSYFYEGTDTEARMENTSTAGGASGTIINQTETSGTFTSGVGTTVQLGQFEFQRNVFGMNGILDFKTSENSMLGVKTGYSKSTFDNPERWERFGRSDLSFDYDTSGAYTTFTPTSTADYQDLDSYTLVRHRLDERQLTEDVFEIQGDWGLNAEPTDKGWGFQTGLKYRAINRDFNDDRTNWTGDAYTLADVAGTDDFSNVQQGGAPGQFLLIDGSLADQTFAANRSSLTESIDENQSNRLDYEAKENVFAFYGQGLYKTDKMSLIFGLRYEQTNFSSSGFRNDGTGFIPTSNSSDYGNLLPSINFAYNTSESTKLRLAYSKTLGRAPFATIAARGESLNDTGDPVTISRGNADLKPRMSDNFDVLFDWYLKKGGLLSAGLFYKNIKDEIFRFTDNETIDINGTPTDALVTQFRNSGENTSVVGVEFNFIKHFSSLPGFWGGFGVSANATFTDTKFKVTLSDGTVIDFDRLAEQPKSTYNAALFYEKYGVKVRFAYNHTGEMWNSRFSNFSSLENVYRNRFQQARDVFDLQLGYEINDHFTVSANLWNLTGEGVQENIGRNQEIQQMNADFGSAWFLGLSYKL